MSFPDAFAHDIVLGPDQVLPTVPRDFGERFTLNWKAARAPDKWWFYDTRMMELWDDALNQLQKATGQNFVNPYRVRPDGAPAPWRPGSAPAPEWQRRLETTDRSTAIDAALKAFDQAREGQFDLPDPRRFEDRVRAEAVKLRQDAERSALASYGAGGLGAFLGAAAGELSHPVNVATLPLGGEYAIANVARLGLLKFLGRNALLEGGAAAASQAVIEAMDAPIQERLATDTGIEDRIDRILTAGVGGAALGLGLSGLVAAVRSVRGARGRMTLEEADAIKVAERQTTFSERNPLGPDGANAHARAMDAAEVAVSEGRHADVREVVRAEVQRQAEAAPSGWRKAIGPDHITIGSVSHPLVAADAPPGQIAPNTLVRLGNEKVMFSVDGQWKPGVTITHDVPSGALIVRGEDGAYYKTRDDAVTDRGRALPTEAEVQAAEPSASPFGRRQEDAEFERMYKRAQAEAAGASRLPVGYKGGIDEGRAAGAIGAPAEANPYRKAIQQAMAANKEPSEHLWQLARDWDSGHIQGVAMRTPDEPFNILDSAAATRPIAENAPVPPEKPPAGMAEAKADEARAMVLQKDFEVTTENGTKRLASEIMAEADDKVKAAKLAAECAAGGAIG